MLNLQQGDADRVFNLGALAMAVSRRRPERLEKLKGGDLALLLSALPALVNLAEQVSRQAVLSGSCPVCHRTRGQHAGLCPVSAFRLGSPPLPERGGETATG